MVVTQTSTYCRVSHENLTVLLESIPGIVESSPVCPGFEGHGGYFLEVEHEQKYDRV